MKEKLLWREFDKIIDRSFKDFKSNTRAQNIDGDLNQVDFLIRHFSEDFDINTFNWENVLIDSSKKLVDFGVHIITENPFLFPSLLKLALSQKKHISQRASRVVYYSIELNISKYNEYLFEILNALKYIKDESIIFSLLRIFTICDLNQDIDLKFLTEFCFSNLNKKVEKIAIKVYALEILYRISNINPEIRYELKNYLEMFVINDSAALASRSSKLLFELQKENKI